MKRFQCNACLVFVLLASLALLVSACKLQTDGVTAEPVRVAEAAASSPPVAPSCSDADFDAFLKRFSTDIAVQKKATVNPLLMSRIDPNAQPEPKAVIRDVPLTEVEWPVIPNLDVARNGGREIVISEDADGYQVMVRTPDTGDQQVYHFARRPCWVLVEVEDQAL